jgi:hypothetical protein
VTSVSQTRHPTVSARAARLASTLAFCLALSWVSVARAATVAILSAAGSSPALSEANNRLRGELSSLRLAVLPLRRPALEELGEVDARAWLERTAEARGIDAALEVLGESTPEAVDVWIFQRTPRRSQVARVELEPDTPNRSGALAIRAIEVLRSYLLEADLAAKSRARAPATTSAASSESRFGLELGAGLLTGLDGVGPAILPVLRSDWRLHPWLVAQATGSGFGTRPQLRAAAGTVRVAQSYGALGLCYCPASRAPLTPYFALAAGVSRTSLEGSADLPALGHSVDHWSLLLDAGLGARLRLSGRYYSTLTGHLQLAQPHVAIHAIDQELGSTGRPNLVANLLLGAWL